MPAKKKTSVKKDEAFEKLAKISKKPAAKKDVFSALPKKTPAKKPVKKPKPIKPVGMKKPVEKKDVFGSLPKKTAPKRPAIPNVVVARPAVKPMPAPKPALRPGPVGMKPAGPAVKKTKTTEKFSFKELIKKYEIMQYPYDITFFGLLGLAVFCLVVLFFSLVFGLTGMALFFGWLGIIACIADLGLWIFLILKD